MSRLPHADRLVERSPAGMTVVTQSGRILEANQAAADILGFDHPEDLVGTVITDLYVNPDERENLLERVEAEGEV